jgi:AcrR family transcriptional regulator
VKQRTEALRERGLATALAVLAEEGVAGLTARAVARRAAASVPAIYEVFGDKAGLIREIFFEGFRMLGDELAAAPPAADPLEALRHLAESFRKFMLANPVVAQIMFARPFADFDPTAEADRAAAKVRKLFVQHVRAAVDAGRLVGDPTDIAHLFLAFVGGLAAAESTHRLGGSKQSVDRRWRLGVDALINGLGPASPGRTGTRPSR